MREQPRGATRKEIALFEAVTRLAATGRDLHGLKVSEIAALAGIGKGTVYEYFKSKEELIGRAILYNLELLFASAEAQMERAQGFMQGFETLAQVVRGAIQQRLSGLQMVVGVLHRGEIGAYLDLQMPEVEAYRARMDALLDGVLAAGEREGLVTGRDPVAYRRFALMAAVFASVQVQGGCPGDGAGRQGYAKQMLLRALGCPGPGAGEGRP